MAIEVHVSPTPKGDVRVGGQVGALFIITTTRGVFAVGAPRHRRLRVRPVCAVQPRHLASSSGAAAIPETYLSEEVMGGGMHSQRRIKKETHRSAPDGQVVQGA